MHQINWSVDRPDEALLEKFRGLPTPIISDAMGRQGSMDHTIGPLFPEAALCGPAVTVKAFPADNLIFHKALQLVRPGDVLVIDVDKYNDAAGWGELMSISAQVLGVAGIVLDGAVRDREAIRRLGFPVFCAAVVPRGTYKAHPGSINVPVSAGGLTVHPGDIVVGDADGVVVIPRNDAAAVADAALQIAAKEDELKQHVRDGRLLFDLLNLDQRLREAEITETDRNGAKEF